jgi:CIC family chloride channel protein
MSLKHRFENYTQLFSNRLSNVDALPQLAILGLLSGIATAVIILIFRFCIEFPLSFFLPNGDPENLKAYREAYAPYCHSQLQVFLLSLGTR